MELLGGLPLSAALALIAAAVTACASILLLWRGSSTPKGGDNSAAAPSVKKLASRKLEGAPSLQDPLKPVCRILYGTQTGTAERFAKQLGKELTAKYGSSTYIDVLDVENYKAAERLSQEKVLVLCMATYGDGEPTDNAAEFYNWLVKEGEAVGSGAKEPYLQGLQYAVFGLGNKQYEHFNKMGKQVHKLLGALGGSPLLRAGEGDDDGSIDDDFEKWCAELHAVLDAQPALLGATDGVGADAAPTAASVAAYDVAVLPDDTKARPAFGPGMGLEAHHPFTASLVLVRELHAPGSDRACVHAEIDVSGSGITYAHGDHIAIHARNAPDVVQEVADMLGVSPDAVITMRMPPGVEAAAAAAAAGLAPPPCAGPVVLHDALALFADVLSPPHKDALRALAAFASEPAEAARLLHLTTAAGKDEYSSYIGRAHRSLLEVMRDFPSARPPLGTFFASIAPRLQPRFYSISSSPALHPSRVHVTCAVVREVKPTGRTHHGVASSWLQRTGAAGSMLPAPVPVFVRRSHFKLPSDPAAPVIMVGPGTGLAPFRGFLQERAAMLQSGAALGPASLFFGCRTRAHDFIYREELEAWLAQGVLSDMHVAFSRDGPAKDYVQHHMERHAARLWTLLSERGAHLYVCGDAKAMAKDVHRTLLALVQAGKACSGPQAEAFVKELQDAGRYQRDVW